MIGDPVGLVSTGVLVVAIAGLVIAFAGYPLLVWATSRPADRPLPAGRGGEPPTVSVIVAVRDGESLVADKIRNTLALDYSGRVDVIVASDGSTDGTAQAVRALAEPLVTLIELADHEGKNRALNAAVERATGEVLLFSDVDARLEPQALRLLVRHLDRAGVGGVCGQRVIGERGGFERGQSEYISLDSRLKTLESRRGSITSNDGKIYAIPRRLYAPLPDGVTDDLFTLLNVVSGGHRFVFEPEARAVVRLPSRNPMHELVRRRRIVSHSLRGILLKRELLNPFRHGRFALGLAANKVLRRMLPLFLLAILASTSVLAVEHTWARVLLAAQVTLYLLAMLQPLLSRLRAPRAAMGPISAAHLVCVGSVGTLLGLVDWVQNKRECRWNPIKSD